MSATDYGPQLDRLTRAVITGSVATLCAQSAQLAFLATVCVRGLGEPEQRGTLEMLKRSQATIQANVNALSGIAAEIGKESA